MGKSEVNHSRYACLLRLGKSSDECKRMLKLTNKMVEAFNGVPANDPQLTLDISQSSTVKNGKYAAYLTDGENVILINSKHFHFVTKLDGEIKVVA